MGSKSLINISSLALTLISSGKFTKKSLSEELGITRPTLDTRLSGLSKWKKLEGKWVHYLSNQK